MKQSERILKLAQEKIAVIRQIGLRGWGKSFTAGFKAAIDFTLENQWIPIGEAMPDIDPQTLKSNRVFVRAKGLKHESYYTAHYDSYTEDWVDIDYVITNVTHWMPIPALKGGE